MPVLGAAIPQLANIGAIPNLARPAAPQPPVPQRPHPGFMGVAPMATAGGLSNMLQNSGFTGGLQRPNPVAQPPAAQPPQNGGFMGNIGRAVAGGMGGQVGGQKPQGQGNIYFQAQPEEQQQAQPQRVRDRAGWQNQQAQRKANA